MVKTQNERLTFLVKFMAADARSIMGKNMRIISSHFNVNLKDIPLHINLRSELDIGDIGTVIFIKELRDVLKGQSYVQGFCKDELIELFTHLCCN